MSEAFFFIPSDVETATGGYGFDRRLIDLMPSLGVKATHVPLAGQYPKPARDDADQAIALLASAPQTAKLIVDGVALGVLPAEKLQPFAERIIGLVHHPLSHDSHLDSAQRQTLFEGERAALSTANHVIVTSASTVDTLVAEFGLPRDKITVAEPGTDPAQRATGTGTPLQLLAVGSIVQRRGYDVLIDSLKLISSQDWRLTIVGALERETETTQNLRRAITAADFEERVQLAGVVVPATLNKFYESADIFVLASLFEGYGMALGDAMARGLPIVCTTSGAAADRVPASAAMKVEPGNCEELAGALRTLLGDGKLRESLADASWEAGRLLPPWNETARRVAAVILDLHI